MCVCVCVCVYVYDRQTDSTKCIPVHENWLMIPNPSSLEWWLQIWRRRQSVGSPSCVFLCLSWPWQLTFCGASLCCVTSCLLSLTILLSGLWFITSCLSYLTPQLSQVGKQGESCGGVGQQDSMALTWSKIVFLDMDARMDASNMPASTQSTGLMLFIFPGS